MIKPEEIKLIIITYGHWDHIGSAKDIKEITGAKIAMHKREKDWLEKSLKPLPPGVTRWGKIFAKSMALFTPFIHVPATNVDIILGDEDFSLAEFGIAGKVISTPGHSPGSVSVVLDTGDAFVGDLAMNAFPMCSVPVCQFSPKTCRWPYSRIMKKISSLTALLFFSAIVGKMALVDEGNKYFFKGPAHLLTSGR